MIIFHITVTVKAEARVTFLTAMHAFAEASRACAGCKKFDLYQALTGEAQFTLYEEWASLADATAYRGSSAFADFRTLIGPLLVAPPESHYYHGEEFTIDG